MRLRVMRCIVFCTSLRITSMPSRRLGLSCPTQRQIACREPKETPQTSVCAGLVPTMRRGSPSGNCMARAALVARVSNIDLLDGSMERIRFNSESRKSRRKWVRGRCPSPVRVAAAVTTSRGVALTPPRNRSSSWRKGPSNPNRLARRTRSSLPISRPVRSGCLDVGSSPRSAAAA